MSTFEVAINPLLRHEGGALVADDHGRGPSRWGVTLATAREFYPQCTPGDIANMDAQQAAAFYRLAFWDRYHIERIEDQGVASKVFDLAVNLGGGTAVRLLQRAVGADIDGGLGTLTAKAVNARPPAEVLAALRAEAERHYRAIVTKHPEWADCLPGWLARLAS